MTNVVTIETRDHWTGQKQHTACYNMLTSALSGALDINGSQTNRLLTRGGQTLGAAAPGPWAKPRVPYPLP